MKNQNKLMTWYFLTKREIFIFTWIKYSSVACTSNKNMFSVFLSTKCWPWYKYLISFVSGLTVFIQILFFVFTLSVGTCIFLSRSYMYITTFRSYIYHIPWISFIFKLHVFVFNIGWSHGAQHSTCYNVPV